MRENCFLPFSCKLMKRSHSFANDDAFMAAVTRVYDDGWSDYARNWKNAMTCRARNGGRFTAAVKPGRVGS
jgi:hypothetical protein